MTLGVAILLAAVAQAKGQSRVPLNGDSTSQRGLPTLRLPKIPKQSPFKVGDTSPYRWEKGGGTSPYPWQSGEDNNSLWKPLFDHIVSDQRAIWTAPEHLRPGDAAWLVPFAGLTAGLLTTDQQFNRHLSSSPTRIKHFDDLSNYGAYAMVGGAGMMYLMGHFTHNEHMREAGFLSGEALIDTYLSTAAIKYSFRRARPMDPGPGEFWNDGTSFPSEHSAAAWALAGVIAHEYPGPLTKIFAYGLASAISASRVPAQKHFPSDVLVGSLIGYLIARHVYLAHHNPDLVGGTWRPFPHLRGGEGEKRQPANMGSPYVPLDSWVYPAFERLEAMGYIDTAFLGMRPWTRLECAHLVEEASNHLANEEEDPPIASRLIQSLQREFAGALNLLGGARNESVEFDSIYTRVTEISGQPLTDGYHFGQTIINDYGRPYSEGFNDVTGFTGWGSAGPFTAYLQGEFQHAPAMPSLPLAARQFIARRDDLPLPPSVPTPAVNRFRALNAYVAMNFENWQVSFGKQSLWWGPGEGGAMMFSDNAEPMLMLRFSRVTPFKLPSIFGLMGPIRTDFFIGRLSGQQFVFGEPTGLLGQWGQSLSDQPMIHGEKISFKPTPNLEFGFSETALFAGEGVPLTTKTLLRSFFSFGNGSPGCYEFSSICPKLDPGDRRSGFDMTYRLPGLRNWVTFYTDSFTDDQISPVAYFDRSANSAGLYFSHLPKLPKFDLRLEGVYTDNPIGGNVCCGFYYSNDRYRSGYTNDGNLIGSWIGRDGQGGQAWLTYWQSPRNYVRFEFRHEKVSQQFVPYGGTVNEGGVEASFWLRQDLSASAFLQYEKWNFPVLRPGPTSDFTTSVQLTYWPRWRWH